MSEKKYCYICEMEMEDSEYDVCKECLDRNLKNAIYKLS